MIRAVQRRINGELALAASEQTRQETGLPTGTGTPHTNREEYTQEAKKIQNIRCNNQHFLCVDRAVEESPAEVHLVSGAAAGSGDVHPAADGGR